MSDVVRIDTARRMKAVARSKPVNSAVALFLFPVLVTGALMAGFGAAMMYYASMFIDRP